MIDSPQLGDVIWVKMHRKPRPEDPRLETLLDQRDHLRIKISLAEDDSMAQADILDRAAGLLNSIIKSRRVRAILMRSAGHGLSLR